MRVLMTGGSGVLGRTTVPMLHDGGHQIDAPSHDELGLFDPASVGDATKGVDAILHLATRIPPPESQGDPDAWKENDHLRREATRLLVDAATDAGANSFVFPSIAFVYSPSGMSRARWTMTCRR